MKKFFVLLIASVAMLQSAHAATSALTESLLEYEAITDAIGTNPDFENVIPQTEFIIDIKRITKQINILGTVKYRIVTQKPTSTGQEACHKRRKHHRNTVEYLAILLVSPNPGVGPNIVTVESIEKISH